jgi:RND family efflux transporter MFP subunit
MPKIFSSKIVIGIVIALVIIIGGYFLFFHHSPTYQFVTVQRGSIAESVSLTGNTIPTQNVSLAFGSSGIVSHTYSGLGKQVQAGQVLAELNTNDLVAQLHQAQANYQKVINGATDSTINVAQATVNTAQVNLEGITKQQEILVNNTYRTLLNSSFGALTVGDYSGYDSPTISGTYTCSQEGFYDLKTYSSTGGISVSYSGLETGSLLLTDIPRPLGNCGLFLSFDKTKTLQAGIEFKIEIPNKNALNYNLNYNAYQLALETESQAVAGGAAALAAAKVSLALTVSAARPEDVAAAQASVDSVTAKIENARIVAPISGTITQFDAKVGQLASPSASLVSIMSSGRYEVDAGISETDIGKVSVNNVVMMTLDAFPNETFAGSVFYIAPAATNTGGIINYQIKISFTTPDPRLKSGLTANINIQTKHKDNVLILPQYAILQNDQGTFVETLLNKKIKQNPVTLGVTDQKGNVEIISGVTEGEQVLNIGLKVQ